jgi:hypothetical protein
VSARGAAALAVFAVFAAAGTARAQDAGVPPVDEAAIKAAIEKDQQQAAAAPAPATAAAPDPGASAQAAVRPPGAGVLNPDTSVIIDGAFGTYGGRNLDRFSAIGIPPAGDDPAPSPSGFSLQEVEVAFTAAVDPYLEGAAFLTIPNLDGIEVEEAYLLTMALPFNLQLKAGAFRSQVGRNNTQHLHLQHFTRRPLMTPLLFGADGFRAPGAQLSMLLPGLPWFAAFYAEAFSVAPPAGGVSTFGGGDRSWSSLAYTAVLEQFWSPSDAASVFLGVNFASARASLCAAPPCTPAPRDYLYGADLYFKWRPPDVTGERFSVMWSTEYFARTITDGGPTEAALYTEPVVQFAKRWFAGGRFDLTGVPSGPYVPRRYGAAASLTFAPTEFSRFRLYAQDLWGPGAPSALVAFVQTEISMGAHGAHPF